MWLRRPGHDQLRSRHVDEETLGDDSRRSTRRPRRHDLERELEHAHAQRHDTFLNGTGHALSTHTRRMFELELEYLRRIPDRVREDAQKLEGGQ
jgi:hypothetical protein